jgi:hypothetical protein
VFQTSFDEFVGDEDEVNADFVRNYLDCFLSHPIKNGVSMKREEALKIYKAIMTKAIERIAKKDTFGLFESVPSYLTCFNTMCQDIACEDHELTAADF